MDADVTKTSVILFFLAPKLMDAAKKGDDGGGRGGDDGGGQSGASLLMELAHSAASLGVLRVGVVVRGYLWSVFAHSPIYVRV